MSPLASRLCSGPPPQAAHQGLKVKIFPVGINYFRGPREDLTDRQQYGTVRHGTVRYDAARCSAVRTRTQYASAATARGPETAAGAPAGHRFRSRVFVDVGEPIVPSDELVESFRRGGAEKRDACNSLLKKVSTGMKTATVQAPDFDTLQARWRLVGFGRRGQGGAGVRRR